MICPHCGAGGMQADVATDSYTCGVCNMRHTNTAISNRSHSHYFASWPVTPSEDKPKLELSFDTECIVGWRVWRLAPLVTQDSSVPFDMLESILRADDSLQELLNMKRPHLTSVGVKGHWPARKRMESSCNQTGMVPKAWAFYAMGTSPPTHPPVAPHPSSPDHVAPVTGCSCGVWSLRSRDDAMLTASSYALDTFVIGEVNLWGRVLECPKGFRAQYAYPKSLQVYSQDEDLRSDLSALYDVPVTQLPSDEFARVLAEERERRQKQEREVWEAQNKRFAERSATLDRKMKRHQEDMEAMFLGFKGKKKWYQK